MLSFPFLISLCSRDPQAKNTLCLPPTRPQSCIMVTALQVPFPFLTHLLSEVSFLLGLLTHQFAWGEKVHKAAVSLVLPAGPTVALSLHFACWPGSCLVLPSLHPALYSRLRSHTLWLPKVPTLAAYCTNDTLLIKSFFTLLCIHTSSKGSRNIHCAVPGSRFQMWTTGGHWSDGSLRTDVRLVFWATLP